MTSRNCAKPTNGWLHVPTKPLSMNQTTPVKHVGLFRGGVRKEQDREVMENVMKQKAVLRKEMNAKLDVLQKSEIERQSDIVTQKVLNHPMYQKAKSVSIYLSFDVEIQTEDLLIDIFKSGKICYIPRFRKGKPDMEMIRLQSLEDYNQLPLNRWNIRQPRDDEVRKSVFESGDLDLVLMPGLAFTKDGSRLGRGKGFYDGFLTRCSKLLFHSPYTLALAFREQIVLNIPCTDSDVPVDCVLFAEE